MVRIGLNQWQEYRHSEVAPTYRIYRVGYHNEDIMIVTVHGLGITYLPLSTYELKRNWEGSLITGNTFDQNTILYTILVIVRI